MNIANKIASLVALLLIGMAINNFVGLHQLATVKGELNQVAQRDILLTEAITEIQEKQLKKGVLIERLLRIAEELAFEDVVPARRIHLTDHLRATQKGFDTLAQEGALAILTARDILKKAMMKSSLFMPIQSLQKASERLVKIEQAHIAYDQSVHNLVEKVQEQKIEISFRELNEIRNEESRLARAIEDALVQVQGFTRFSLESADKAQQDARQILLYSLYISIALGGFIAFLIIRGIANPLKILMDASKKVGEGNLNARIENVGSDEIGQLSQAFNLMAEQLMVAKNELEQKNRALADALDLTSEQKRDLEKVNRELDNFVSKVSHDIRAPLTGISGYSLVLKKGYYDQLDKRGQRSLDGIQKGSERMDAMVNDLLELTRLSRQKNPYESTDMNNVVDEVCDRLEYRIEQRQAKIQIADDFPVIVCDKIKMGVVFFNLINNAMKFCEQEPFIEIGYSFKDHVHEFFVKDNGIGIAAEDQAKVFEMFTRVDHASKFEGTGAGLSFVKEIIEEHHGKIWMDSTPGSGSTFYFTIATELNT